ncbi:hypothetical protein C1645_11566 [Glomus cerebriforme]|uniref:USP domain-containing protein n=1 Tax=Glomus cerebriforme TaxID=658196 RepID=A0A397T6S5_9GLOM|nr:hypothetical protein C1645_11566 [Glomus cerebriforme]
MKRVKLDDTTPLGLRSNVNYGCAGPFFQALFHIPIFRSAILAYRPTRDDWGEVKGYWNGKSRGLSNEYGFNNYYPEFKTRSYTKFIHEFQKLFGFLSLSQRVYGDASSLIDALAYEENRNKWDDVSVQDFFIKILDVIVQSTAYRDLIDLDPGIPDSLSEYIMPFDRLLKSLGRNEIHRNYNYQPEKKDEDVLCIPLEITPYCNTVYAAFDQIVRYKTEPLQKVFFSDLAKILIFTLKHHDSFIDGNFISGDPGFHIHKELYMDRYLLNRAEDIEKRWHQLEGLKLESEKINHAIRRITEYQGRHNGLDLLKGSIEYFRRKCDKARNIGFMDDDAQKTCSFLEGILEKVEQKFKDLIERKDELDMKIRDIFDTPDMKKVVYRLKAVLGSERQQHYAYIWVSKGSKTETISSNNEDGNWWKFSDTTVEETFEERVLNDTSGLHANSSVYSLIYVNADIDYNFSNINDLIPSSLKEYVKKDNHLLDEELSTNEYRTQDNNRNDYNSNDNYYDNNNYNNNYNYNYYNSNYNNDDDNYNDYNSTDQDVIMGDSGETNAYNSDSITYGENHTNHKIQYSIDTTEQQEKNIVSIHPIINLRFEIFCIKLGQVDLFKSLIRKYYDVDNSATLSWDDPLPLDTRYRDDPIYKKYVELFNKYKEITLYFTEGLERVSSDEYRNALAYFKYAIDLENDWIDNLSVTDRGNSVRLNGEKLQRSKEIDAYARACLKVEHDGFLGKIRCKSYVTRGLKDGLQILQYIVRYIGASNCAEDDLFKQFRHEFEETLEKFDDEFSEEQQKLIDNLFKEYTQPKESSFKNTEYIEESTDLYGRYKDALKLCSKALKKYKVPSLC